MSIKEHETVRYKIWNELFLCEMRQIDTLSDEHIKYFGVHTTFDPSMDRDLYNELTPRYLTIIKMIKYYVDGVNIRIKDRRDCKTIYMLLQDHLMDWAEQMNDPLGSRVAPVEELRAMDEFASVVYNHARDFLDEEFKGTRFERAIKDDLSVMKLLKPRDEFVGSKENQDSEFMKVEVVQSTRRSMEDIFVRSTQSLQRD